jgi:hypothetical protein
MFTKFNYETWLQMVSFSETLWPCFASNQKVLSMAKKKSVQVLKNTKFYAGFKFVVEFKKFHKKIQTKPEEKLLLYVKCQKKVTFLCELFLNFFKGVEPTVAYILYFFYTPTEF